MAAASTPDGDVDTLHIRCGSDIRETLREAGFRGAFLEYSDPLCRGPVPRDGPLLEIRSQFLSTAYMFPAEEVARGLAAEAEGVERARDVERVVLWFEHDSYDQLILARVLAAFAEGALPRHLEAVIIDSYPGIERFVGLGMLAPDALRQLWERRRLIRGPDLDLGGRVWAALREPDPRSLHAIAVTSDLAIPQMGPALGRHLQELPWSSDGLSLTQRLVLEAIDAGHRTGSAVFRHLYHRSEPLPFLGDLMLWADIEDMAAAQRPPLDFEDSSLPWPERGLSLTEAGERILAGTLDWRDCDAPPRWVGGVEIHASKPDWRWSPVDRRPARAD